MVILENIKNSDTIKLLKECDLGTKMAVSSIDEVLELLPNTDMKQLLTESKNHHEKLGNEIHTRLTQHNIGEHDPSPIAKGMSWLETNIKIGMDNSDEAVADLITNGCDMGIKSLNKYLNLYQTADINSKHLCKKLISIEEKLSKELRKYL
ncbi:MAG: hypothetical protein RR957_05195 [Oscillospiraceae bacterium]